MNKNDKDDVERCTFETIKDHRWSKEKTKNGNIHVLISWYGYEEVNWELMETIKKDDPVTLSKYAFGNNLIDEDIWKWASRYAKNFKKMN